MPLSPAVPREPIHARNIECRGYRRADGLWDIEGRLTDVKTYAFDTQWRGEVQPGEPIHDMWIRLTVDDGFVIRGVEAVTDRSPFPVCPAVTPNFRRLEGLGIRSGFLAKVRELLGGTEGCTHLVDLVGRLGTVAFQTIHPYRERLRRLRGEPAQEAASRAGRRPPLLDTCHAFASDGEVVKRQWPDFYTGR